MFLKITQEKNNASCGCATAFQAQRGILFLTNAAEEQDQLHLSTCEKNFSEQFWVGLSYQGKSQSTFLTWRNVKKKVTSFAVTCNYDIDIVHIALLRLAEIV